ncbi:MAG TPA: hypothetical protein VGB03_01770 [Acidimicrobiales bacterium]
MATTEQSRRRLYRELTEVMGEERATLLVDELPPVDWANLATKRDLEDEIAGVRHEIADLRIATTRDIEDLRTATTRDIAELRVEMDNKFALVHKEFERMHASFVTKDEMHREMRSLTVTLFFGNAALAGLVSFFTALMT